MAVRIKGSYLGNNNTELIHEPSSAVIKTTPPKDNQGDGTCFSPTDLCAASLASCVMTICALYADKHGISVSGAYFEIEKHMSTAPRRIAELRLEIHLPNAVPEESRAALEQAGRSCPVSKSLHPDLKQEIRFLYDV